MLRLQVWSLLFPREAMYQDPQQLVTSGVQHVEAALATGYPVNIGDADGEETILHWAARRGHLPIVSLALTHGGDPNQRNRWGATPLWTAAYRGTPAVLQALIEAGGDVNVRDRDGYTVLMAVVVWAHGDAAGRLAVLLRHEALDLGAALHGLTAAEIARGMGPGKWSMADAIQSEVIGGGEGVAWRGVGACWIRRLAGFVLRT
jgi:hypothetical protein